jgi:hypothetical protein
LLLCDLLFQCARFSVSHHRLCGFVGVLLLLVEYRLFSYLMAIVGG